MKRFREENPLIFYGALFIIGILIYSKLIGNQSQYVEVETAPIMETTPLEEPQTETEPSEEELHQNREEVRKNREEELAKQNDPNRRTFVERSMDLAVARTQRKESTYVGERPDLLKKSSIFKDDVPYGQSVSIYFDNFYKKYHINFYNEAMEEVQMVLLEENFEYYGVKKSDWSFKYKGSIYRIE